MKQKVLDEQNNKKIEWGFTMNSIMNPDGSFNYPKTPLASSPGLTIELEYTQITIFGAHTHPSDGYSIPSFGDVYWLRNVYQQASSSRQKDVTLLTVCKDKISGQAVVYALFVSDFGALNTKINLKLAEAKYSSLPTEKSKIDAIVANQAVGNEANKDNLERHFLQEFNSYGISLFKAANNDLTQWEKLELNTNPNALPGQQLSVAGVPCN
ncbi:hypothetical protein [Flavobacterium sp.]|uniref:hypothetical protein n=1 Tax=Flavobacterium sp. TaxID=239 RepID=UPI003341FA86